MLSIGLYAKGQELFGIGKKNSGIIDDFVKTKLKLSFLLLAFW